MLSRNSRLRALKYVLYSYYVDSKTIYGIYIGIMTGLLISRLLFATTGSISGSLDSGFINGTITLMISIIVITSNSELLKKFSFPVNRNMLVLSHIILILVFPLVMLLTSCGYHLLDLLISGLTTRIVPGFFYTNVIAKSSFLTGFVTSYITMVCASAITWFVFAWFYRHKIITSVVGGVFILLSLYWADFQDKLIFLFDDIFSGSSPGMFFLKLLMISLISFVLGYIPIKRMEVKQ